jgi:DNA-binding MarR family transcriptional regulator
MAAIEPESETGRDGAAAGPARRAARQVRLIELVFFGYRDFVAEADRILAGYGFGRAHHRVLHFVNRHPGVTVATLLAILGITKQSLAPVLKDLLNGGFIEQASGAADRRQRLLSVTRRGADLAGALVAAQSRRIEAALEAAGPGGRAAVEAFLLGLVDEANREDVTHLIGAAP